MALFDKFRIPYSRDIVFGFLLLTLLLVPTAIAPQLTEEALLFSDPLETVKLVVWSVFVGLALFIVWRRSKAETMLPKPIIWLLVAFLSYSFISFLFSYDKINSLFGVAFRMNSSIWFFLVWSAWIWLLSLVSQEQFKILVKIFLIAGFLISALAVLQSYGIGFYPGLTLASRLLIPSFLGNPNFAAMFVGTAIPVLFWSIGKEQSRVWRLSYVFFAAVMVWSLVLFSSRAAMLGAVVALGLLFAVSIWQRRWKVTLGMLIGIVAIAALGLFYLQVTRPDVGSIDSADKSTVERYYIWDLAAQYLPQRALTGSGLGNYFIAYRQNHESELAAINWFDDPHNLIFFLAVSGGIPLALIFIFLVGLPIWQGTKQSLADRQSIEPAVWASAIVAWLVAASFGPVSVPNWMILGLLIIAVYRSIPLKKVAVFGKLRFRLAGALGLLLIIIGLAFTASEVLSWQAQIQLAHGHDNLALKLIHGSMIANPTNAAAAGSWAIIARVNHDPEESARALRYAQKLHPRSAAILQQVFLGYIRLWNDTKDPQYRDQAMKIADIYKDSNPNYFVTYRDLTMGYLALGENGKSLDAAQKLTVIANQDYNSWVLLTQIYKINGLRSQMLGSYEQAFQLRPNHLVGQQLTEAKKQPDIDKITLPFGLPDFSGLVF